MGPTAAAGSGGVQKDGAERGPRRTRRLASPLVAGAAVLCLAAAALVPPLSATRPSLSPPPRPPARRGELLWVAAAGGAVFGEVGDGAEVPLLRLRGGSGWGASWGSPASAATSPFQIPVKKDYNPEGDAEAEHAPSDGASALAFSPAALAPKNYLVASSWDCTVRCWEVDAATGKAAPVGIQRHEKPALCCGWTADGRGILSGGADGKAMLWDIGSGQWRQVAQHDAPVVGVFHSELPSPCVITGSWDRTVKFWKLDPGAEGQQLGALQMPDRVLAMDVRGSVMVVATAERHILVYDLCNLAQPFRQKFSPLKYQSRCVAIFPDQTGFCVGSVEGRVAIEHILDADLPRNFAFKCHRQNADSKQPEVYTVNSIRFHRAGTFATCGSDGAFNFWDKDAKHRLKAFARSDRSLSASDFSHGGELFAYAASYDWAGGLEGMLKLPQEGRESRVMVHLVKSECAPKANSTKQW